MYASLVQVGFGFRPKKTFRGIAELSYFIDNLIQEGKGQQDRSVHRMVWSLLSNSGGYHARGL